MSLNRSRRNPGFNNHSSRIAPRIQYNQQPSSTALAIERIRESQKEKQEVKVTVSSSMPVASTQTPPPQQSPQHMTPRLDLPAAQASASSKKRKPKDQSASTVAELLQTDEAERRRLKNNNQPQSSTTAPTISFQKPARPNGYNARKQNNLSELAATESTQQRLSKR
jgi:hypothetical protein